jgi:hypothetical protein
MIVAPNQTIIDLAIQHSGSAEAAFSLAAINGLSVTDALTVGTELLNVPVVNQAIVDYYAANGIVPASRVIYIPKNTYVAAGYVAAGYVV